MAGFDLTFSVPKSISAVWAIADGAMKEAIVAASQAGQASEGPVFPAAFQTEVAALARELPDVEPFVVQRLLIDVGGYTCVGDGRRNLCKL